MRIRRIDTTITARVIVVMVMSASNPQPPVTRNQLLAALPPDVLAQLLPKLRRTNITAQQVVYRQETPIRTIYFLEEGMVSMVANMEDGVQVEVGIVGREGMVGHPLIFGGETAFNEAVMQIPDTALSMSAAAFRQEMDDNPPFRSILFRFAEAFYAQVSQTAACNGRHDLEQRLARWLLMAHDQVDGDELPLTQNFIATMLGVHRPSVTITAGILQRAGLIRYANGSITILARAGLEEACCECYGIVQKKYKTLIK